MFAAGASVAAIALWYPLIGWRFRRFVAANRAAMLITKPYMKQLAHSKTHILVIGDSTMYDAGIKDPANTMGGLLAVRYLSATAETIAVNGARVHDLPQQIHSARYKQYKLILVGIGGNDIVKLSGYRRLGQKLSAFLTDLSKMSDQIVLAHRVNVGNIGFFPFPLSYFFDYRASRLSQVYTALSESFPSSLW